MKTQQTLEVDTECVSENGNQFKPDVHLGASRKRLDISESAKIRKLKFHLSTTSNLWKCGKINATVLLPGVRQNLEKFSPSSFPAKNTMRETTISKIGLRMLNYTEQSFGAKTSLSVLMKGSPLQICSEKRSFQGRFLLQKKFKR